MNKHRHYYIAPRDVAMAAGHRFASSFHFVDLDEKNVLLSVAHRNDDFQAKFEEYASVEPLPDVDDPSPIEDKHVDMMLKHDAIKALGIKRNDPIRRLAKAIKKLHKGM